MWQKPRCCFVVFCTLIGLNNLSFLLKIVQKFATTDVVKQNVTVEALMLQQGLKN